MNTMTTTIRRGLIAIALSAAIPGIAFAGHNARVDDIARATGLTCSEVQMLVGARTPHPEYFTSYDRAQRRMVRVLGEQRFRDLMAGREIVLDNGQRLALVER
jgi:hypothetical protein